MGKYLIGDIVRSHTYIKVTFIIKIVCGVSKQLPHEHKLSSNTEYRNK